MFQTEFHSKPQTGFFENLLKAAWHMSNSLSGARILMVIGNLTLVAAIAVYSDRFISGFGSWFHDLTRLSPLIAFGYVSLLSVLGAFKGEAMVSRREQLWMTLVAWAGVFSFGTWAVFIFKAGPEFSRLGVVGIFLMGSILLPMAQVVYATRLRNKVRDGSLVLERIAVICHGKSADFEIEKAVLRSHGFSVTSINIIPQEATIDETLAATLTETVRQAVAEGQTSRVILYIPWESSPQILDKMSLVPARVTLVADSSVSRVVFRGPVHIGSRLGFDVQRPPLSRSEQMLKRLLDIVVSLLALVIATPLLLLTTAAIALESGKPILFKQTRKGIGGRLFNILKFRSMTVVENGNIVSQAQRNDPRVTPLGRILRRTSIDELPQLINVLRGEMSIVGPRPHALAHDNYYDNEIVHYYCRQNVKPGITGWAQVNGLRGETKEVSKMHARVEHDLWYIRNWSFWLDIKIIALTAVRLVSDRNAY